MFLPSGTMCNAIGFRCHIRPGGDAVHLHPTSHPIVAEGGGPSALSGAVLAPVAGEGGMFTAGTLEAAAGCRWALDHHVDRLAEDHANARILAEGRPPSPRCSMAANGAAYDPE